MGLFKKKGRADIEAWAKALIQGYKKGMPVDRSVLEKEMNRKRVAVTGSSFSYNSENVKWTDKTLADQKIDNLLNLAMDSTEREREKSWNLNVGYDEKMRLWDVIVKYSGSEEGLLGEGITVVPLLGGYAIVT